MISFERSTGADPRSLALCAAMDTETSGMYLDEFAQMDAAARAFMAAAFVTVPADLVDVVIALDDGVPIGHAALRALADGGFEVKKVYVIPSARGRGLSRALMTEVEKAAREREETTLRLQTGFKQVEAIALYASLGYQPIGEFGPYVGLKDMVYLEKTL